MWFRSTRGEPSPTLLSSVPFGAFLAYSPRGTSPLSRQSRAVCYEIKRDGPSAQAGRSMIVYAVNRMRGEERDLGDLLAPDVVLIPVPRSAPFPPGQRNALWVPDRICEALNAAGYGSGVLRCLVRVTSVAKSAGARPGERPAAWQHLESMEVRRTLVPPDRITLVDDVVTKGATLIAAASLVQEAFPRAVVRCFSLVRTMGLVPDVQQLVDPVVGEIRFDRGGWIHREP